MAVTTAPTYVQAPNQAAQPRYGLFKVATGPLELPEKARNGGLQYETGVCVLPRGYAVACPPGSKTFDAGFSTITGNPFVVIATAVCGSMGLDDARARQLVTQRLFAGEQAIVELVLSDGSVGAAPSLANNNPNLTMLTAATNVVLGVGALEDWLYARYGLPGVIHASPEASVWFQEHHLIDKDSAGIWRTAMGTAVSFGNYSGLTAAGAAPAAGHTTLYITGQVAVYRTPDSGIYVSPWGTLIDRSTNQSYMVAEREYVVTYDCMGVGIDVTLA